MQNTFFLAVIFVVTWISPILGIPSKAVDPRWVRAFSKQLSLDEAFSLARQGGLTRTNLANLLIYKVEINNAKRNDRTLLHEAVLYDQLETANLILSVKSTDPNVQDGYGDTPLHYAIRHHNPDMVKLLIFFGANRSLANKAIPKKRPSQTPQELAELVKNAEILNYFQKLHSTHSTMPSSTSEGYVSSSVPIKINIDVILRFIAKEILELLAPMLNTWLSQGHTINEKISSYNETLLHKAATFNSSKSVSLLITKGSNVNAVDMNGSTPLHLAVMLGNEKMVKILLDAGANVTIKDHTGFTPLNLAGGTMRQLLEETARACKARSTAKNSQPESETPEAPKVQPISTIVIISALIDDTLTAELIRGWLASGHDINEHTMDMMGSTLLHKAVWYNKIKSANLLIAYGSRINEQDEDGNAPLHRAVKLGHLAMIKLLLNAGARVNITNKQGCTVFDIAINDTITQLLEEAAIKQGFQTKPTRSAPKLSSITEAEIIKAVKFDILTPEMLDAWLKQGHDINEKFGVVYIATLLHRAVLYGSIKSMHVLLAESTPNYRKVNEKDSFGSSPLHDAVHHNRENMVEILLQVGADVTLTNALKQTPLEIARVKGNPVIIQLLEKAQPIKQPRHIPVPPIVPPLFTPETKPSPIPIPRGMPKPAPKPPQAGAPAGRSMPPVVAQAAAPIIFNRKKIIIAVAAGSLAAVYAWYRYWTPTKVPTDLTQYSLAILLTTALKNKNYEYAYELVYQNPQAVQAMVADTTVLQEIKKLIEQEQSILIDEEIQVGKSLNPFKTFGSMSISTQHKYLATLLDKLEDQKVFNEFEDLENTVIN